tara:strand:- start:670 stop:1221 length:552 start_codon:yes stop_codon:yes gene_type:complete
MDNKKPSKEIDSINEETNSGSNSIEMPEPAPIDKKESKNLDKSKTTSVIKPESSPTPKKPAKPPKLEDKPFEEFVSKHLIPGLKSSIEDKGTLVNEIKLIEGKRPVIGGNCWMVFCEISDQRKFWLCFNKNIITSDKTILLAESNSDPSIVESFLIDEKKTTLPLLISRVLQRLNGQKWIGVN